MANGFDRIERFFSKRKGSAAASATCNETSTAPSTAPNSPTQQSTELQFPSPSFIRPKTSRMAAREEVRQRLPGNRSPSSSNASSPNRKASTQTSSSGITAISQQSSQSSHTRSSSIDSQCCDQYPPLFRGFSFPKPPPSRSGETISSHSPHSFKNRNQHSGSHILRPPSPLTRLDTPPSSDPEDSPLSKRRPKARKLQIIPYKALPTPEASPRLGPQSDWNLHAEDFIVEDLRLAADDIVQEPTGNPSFARLTEAAFLPAFDLPSPHFAFAESSLREPEIDDFFSLSDESVAEVDEVDQTGLDSAPSNEMELVETPVPTAPSTPALQFNDSPLLTLETPGISRPAQLGAFEAARIASRYSFDMLYVVNLWPDTPVTNTPDHLSARTPQPEEITGRLLASFGLHNGPMPFQISSRTHLKILRSSGWLEYRDSLAQSDEFYQAYAHAFYPGQHKDDSTTVSAPLTADRGLVFAAYRKHGSELSPPEPEELDSLRRDVEAMVEMLIDIHVTSQLRSPLASQKSS